MNIITARPHRLLPAVIERIGARVYAGEPCMLLVPAQTTLRAEIEVMTRLNLPGSFLIDILSPGRLQSRVFERAGRPQRTVFDERGKRMVLTEVIESVKDELTIYRAAAVGGAQGLVQKMSALIADIKRGGMTAEDLREQICDMPDGSPAARKLADALLVYQAYERRMAGQLADGEDVAAEMRARMRESGVLDGQHVYIYGFDMITPSFAQDILHMAQAAASLTLAVETDRSAAPDGRLFAPVNYSLQRLTKMAEEMGIPIKTERIDAPLHAPADIAQLERGLYAVGRPPEAGAPTHIALRAASGKRMEVHMAASAMRRLAAQGVHGSEMAVVYPKGGGYAPLLQAILPQYGIPVYVAEKRAGGSHPLSRFLLTSLAIVSGGWRAADICDGLKTGFWPLEEADMEALCAYCEATDVREGSFRRPFTYIKDGTPEQLAALNASREAVCAPLERLAAGLREARHADSVIAALWALLEEVDAFTTLGRMRDDLRESGLNGEADDCAQVWNALMETLDQLHTLLGERAIPAKTVLELLTSGLGALELSALPPADGAVICGEIGNVRTEEVGTLFAIGMNDAPAAPDDALLTGEERAEAAARTDLYLGMTDAERAALAQLDELKALSGARERILVSYALADETGAALREGTAVQALRRLFPEMPLRGGLAEKEREAMLIAPDAAMEALSVQLSEAADGKGDVAGAMAQAYAALNSDEAGRERLIRVTRGLTGEPPRRIDGAQARALYGRPVMSVSRLETFAACPMRHFITYGLAPARRQEPGVDAAELGTLYHEAADAFTRSASALPEFPNLTAETIDSLMAQAVEPLIAHWRQSPLGASKRGASIARRIRRKAQLAGRSIVAQFAGSAFRVYRTELVFGKNGVAPFTLELADGSLVYLQGRIDRVDVMDDGHIRVIDLKSGSKKFDATMAYYGLQLQLLLYLAAAMAAIPGSEAAGFFYARIADPTIKTDSRIREEVERQIAKRLALAGVALADVEILRAQGEHHAAMITKDGKPSGLYKGQMADDAALSGMVAFARRRAAQLAQGAFAGDIDDSPAQFMQYSACAACDCREDCGYDASRKPPRRLQKKSAEDLV